MDNHKEKIEKVLSEALELKEKGVTLLSITAMHPEFKKEIEGMFDTLTKLQDKSNTIPVSEFNLLKIFATLKAEEELAQKEKMPAFSRARLSTYFKEYGWTIGRIAAPVFAIIAIVGGIAIKDRVSPTNENSPEQVATTQNASSANVSQSIPAVTAPTGNINQAVEAFKKEQAGEAAIASQNNPASTFN